MKIFIVNGQGGSGKDTFEQFVGECCPNGAAKISMVSYVKQIAEKFGWQGQKEEKDRLMLSRLKDLLSDWDDSPFKTTCMAVKQMEKDGFDICFIDARNSEDIDRLKNYFENNEYSIKTVFVERGHIKTYGNKADDNVYNFNYDIIIDNSKNLDNLKNQAISFYNKEVL